jgi:Tol biopolymer transport system component
MVDKKAIRRTGFATVVAVAVSAFVLPVREASAVGLAYTMSTLVSSNASGSMANDSSGTNPTGPLLSTDGRYAVFASAATNLVADDLNGQWDVFVKDRLTGVVDRVSVSTSGAEADALSTTASISGDGRYVAFMSDATNLVPGDTNGVRDVFVRDRVAGTTSRLSVDGQGLEADGPSDHPSISADGNWVAFESEARNLVSGDGPTKDVFVADVRSRAVELVSVGAAGAPTNLPSGYPRMSADGRYVVFQSEAENLVLGDTNHWLDVFLRDRTAQTTERLVEGAVWPAISADGATVAFASGLDTLVSGDTNRRVDVFVLDLSTGTTVRTSVDTNGIEANDDSVFPSISGDGRFVTFTSMATNLDPIDTDQDWSAYVHDTVTGDTRFVARRGDGTREPGRALFGLDISADGNIIAGTKEDPQELPDQVWQVYTWRRDGKPQLVCIFVDMVMCELQVTNEDKRFHTIWEINRKIWREYDNHTIVRFACRPGEEVTLRVVVVGTEDRPIEATVTGRCVRGRV